MGLCLVKDSTPLIYKYHNQELERGIQTCDKGSIAGSKDEAFASFASLPAVSLRESFKGAFLPGV
jgi:hypothetical protein